MIYRYLTLAKYSRTAIEYLVSMNISWVELKNRSSIGMGSPDRTAEESAHTLTLEVSSVDAAFRINGLRCVVKELRL